MVNIWDRADAAGHDFTVVSGPLAGSSLYYCERCGSILITRSDKVEIFHPPVHLPQSSLDECPGVDPKTTLKERLEKSYELDLERLRSRI